MAAPGTDSAEECQQSERESVCTGCETMQRSGGKREGQEWNIPKEEAAFLLSFPSKNMSEGGGTRTHDQRIKSPLLYRLSYALKGCRTIDLCQTDRAAIQLRGGS